MSEKSKFYEAGARLGAALGRFIIRAPLYLGLLTFMIWLFGDRMPSPILWFIAGAMFHDFWCDKE